MIKQYLSVLTKENFVKNDSRIKRENQIGTELILHFYLIILILNVLVKLVSWSNPFSNPTLTAQVIYIVVALIFNAVFLRRQDRNYTLWIYLTIAPMLLITMIGGILSKPNEMTFTFLFYLLLLPLLILDNPKRIGGFVLVMAVVYAILEFTFKPSKIFWRDMMHLINVVLMSTAASLYFLTIRIRNMDYAEYFAEMADEDPMTGLFNRAGARHHINPAKPCIFIYLDLDQFKSVNDRFGHEAGDAVIVSTAKMLRSNFRYDDVVIRLGGDEFAVYAPGGWTVEYVEDKLEDLLKGVREIKPDKSGDSTEHMTASIGCAYAPHGRGSVDELMRDADRAMYEVKKSGKDAYRIVTV